MSRITNIIVITLALITASGCTSYSAIRNEPHTFTPAHETYSILDIYGKRPVNDVSVKLFFSGGGTRAAALAYSVLLELRDTIINVDGHQHRLLDDVSAISSVSGGSFTAAYYGLYGDRIFDEFEDSFLRKNVQSGLINRLYNPLNWFSLTGRSEVAAEYYQENIFGNATFADMRRGDAPLVLINASDLSTGARISFVQEYFNILCSDIDSFPVAKAVAASSAVPLLFSPVVLENYSGCDTSEFIDMLDRVKERTNSTQVALAASGLEKIAKDKDSIRYLHLVDGSVTDNLGLRAPYEIINFYGGLRTFFDLMGQRNISKNVLIVVNASTEISSDFPASRAEPALEQSVDAITNIFLQRYNSSTIEVMQESIRRWNYALYPAYQPIETYFIEVNIRDVVQKERQAFLNEIPTSLALDDEQVDALIVEGRKLLRNHPQFQRLIETLNH